MNMEDNNETTKITNDITKVKAPVDLDQALEIAGVGCYNLKYYFVLTLFLIAVIVEPVGFSFVLPAAVCDLNMSSSLRGFVGSVPYIGIILTSYPWGYVVDTKGRKVTLIYASLAAGTLSVASAFMPDVISFTIFKFLTSLCIGCPAAIPYTLIGEIFPQKHRVLALSITNSLQILSRAFIPLLAWAILPLDFRVDFGAYYFRSWRLLVIVNASFFFIASVLLAFGPESPKYLVSQKKHDEALKVLQTIYAGNKKKSPMEYPITQLKMDTIERQNVDFFKSLKAQTLPILKPPLLKWLVLNGFILFGMFSVLHGLYLWVPDILNRVFSGASVGFTACEVIAQRLNETTTAGECDDTIDEITYIVNAVANVSCALIAFALSNLLNVIGKKNLLVAIPIVIGTFCILINFITEDVVFAILLSSFPILAVVTGPVNAYTVEIFPTHLRGMAVSLTNMMGRVGSAFGTNVAGAMINTVCETTFYFFGALLIVCGLLCLLLPKSGGAKEKRKSLNSPL